MNRKPSSALRPPIALAAGVLFAGLLLGAATPSARAGHLDVALLEQQTGAAENVLLSLHEKGYKNVGVLPFHVTKGPKEKSGYDVAPIALNLTTRLENALILSQDARGKVVGIIRDAAGTAPPAGLKAYQAEKCGKDDFEELFAEQYSLAWDDKKVKADAFLTGRVINPSKPDSPFVTVIIEIFDRTSRDTTTGKVKRTEVKELRVRRDRALLADLGIAFNVPGDKLDDFLKGRGPASDERDTLIKPNGGWKTHVNDKKDVKPRYTPDDVGGMSFTLAYAAKKGDKAKAQTIKPNAEGIFEAPTPAVGSTITMTLKHLKKDDRTRAFVIKVNGQSLWMMEDQESELCHKWLLDPGKSEEFGGFYFGLEGKNLKPFVVEPIEKTRGKNVGPRLGWIDVAVYAEAEPDRDDKKDDKDKLASSSKVVSLRSGGAPASYDGKALKRAALSTKPLTEVQAALQRENNVEVKPILFPRQKGKGLGKNVISSAGSAKPGGYVREKKALDNPQLIGSVSVRYYYGK